VSLQIEGKTDDNGVNDLMTAQIIKALRKSVISERYPQNI
jgi:hypothetical protein